MYSRRRALRAAGEQARGGTASKQIQLRPSHVCRTQRNPQSLTQARHCCTCPCRSARFARPSLRKSSKSRCAPISYSAAPIARAARLETIQYTPSTPAGSALRPCLPTARSTCGGRLTSTRPCAGCSQGGSRQGPCCPTRTRTRTPHPPPSRSHAQTARPCTLPNGRHYCNRFCSQIAAERLRVACLVAPASIERKCLRDHPEPLLQVALNVARSARVR